MHLGAATAADARAIQSIYAHHVRHGVGAFEEEPPDRGEIESRMRSGCSEDSVYVRPGTTSPGVGGRLLAALVLHARSAGLRLMVAAGASSDDAASIALHERTGFIAPGC